MKYVKSLPRWILGLIFFVFGLNGFFHFIPMPESMPEGAMKFGGAMMATGYFMQLVAATQVFCGALFLANKWVPLALVVLAPVTVNIFLFHLFLTPGASQLVMPVAIILMQLYVASEHKKAFKPLFK